MEEKREFWNANIGQLNLDKGTRQVSRKITVFPTKALEEADIPMQASKETNLQFIHCIYKN